MFLLAVKKVYFHDALKNTSVPEGKMVRLECKFSGEPKPQIQWLCGNTPIMASAVFKVHLLSLHSHYYEYNIIVNHCIDNKYIRTCTEK